MSESEEFSLTNNSLVAASPDGHFRELYIDFDQQCLYATGVVSGIGQMRVYFQIDGFDSNLSFSDPDDEGMVAMSVNRSLDSSAMNASIAKISELNDCFSDIWPAILEALLSIRKDYGAADKLTPENAKLSFTPPGDYADFNSDYWMVSVEIEPWDGYFGADFNLDGEVLDTSASF